MFFAQNHAPDFFVDEAALPTGIRAMASLAVDYLLQKGGGPRWADGQITRCGRFGG